MSAYSWRFVLRRFGLLVLVVWTAVTLNFLIPKLTPRNPLREKLLEQASRSGYIEEGFDEMVAAYEAKFGLDQPLWKQYIRYIADVARGDLGYSIANYPQTVVELVGQALPWTLALLTVATIVAFILGTLLGALMAWPRSSNFVKYILPSFLILGAVPAYLVALILIYFVAFRWKMLPLGGGYSISTIPNLSVSFALEVVKHSILPALAIILTSMGGWVIGMRGMMVTVQGEDYMTFGEAKGLKERRLFYKYGVRNALLPQVTGLALAFSVLVSGSVLVELVFQYPGVGTLLARAINQLDYFMIYGIVLIIVVSIAIAMFIMDMIYPLLDPRIAYEK
ncbi:MAG TPA: ABC transporter permease [Caldilineaceae bacterium]|nr:ABC transporter permease [Caldilineaceae bacterium]